MSLGRQSGCVFGNEPSDGCGNLAHDQVRVIVQTGFKPGNTPR